MTEDTSKTPPLSEKALFLAADEIEDPAAREAFLVEQCQGNNSLFARLQTLFDQHH